MLGSFVFILGIVFLQYWICLYFRWFDIFWRAWTSIQILCTGERKVSNELLTWLLVSHIQLLILDCILWKIWRCGGHACSVRRTFVLFLRDERGVTWRDTHEMRNAKKKRISFSCSSSRACLASRVPPLNCQTQKKFDACSVRYILIGSMVRVVSAKT